MEKIICSAKDMASNFPIHSGTRLCHHIHCNLCAECLLLIIRVSIVNSTPSRVTGSRMVFIAKVALGNYFESSGDINACLELPNDFDSIQFVLPKNETNSDVQVYEQLTYTVMTQSCITFA